MVGVCLYGHFSKCLLSLGLLSVLNEEAPPSPSLFYSAQLWVSNIKIVHVYSDL